MLDGLRSNPETPWVHGCAFATGTRHLERGVACQDAVGVRVVGSDANVCIVALSDGAGSAAYAEEGAAIVVREWMSYFSNLLEACPNPAQALSCVDSGHPRVVLQHIRNSVGAAAGLRGCDTSEFSATLLGAVLTPEYALVAQVGDGAWVVDVHGVIGCATWPLGGEFVGQTTFATCESAEARMQLVRLEPAPRALAGFTDGLERLLLDFQGRLPATGFFRPVFKSLRTDAVTFTTHLEEFLNSPRVCTSTDDDKSMALVVNRHADF